MTNLTIALDEAIVRKARIRAIHEGTSVSAKVREFLAEYAQESDRQLLAGQAFIAAARSSTANSEGARWSREDVYDRPFASVPTPAAGRKKKPA